jgi:hypothetical protein
VRKFICFVAILAFVLAGSTATFEVAAQGAPSEAALDRVFQDVSVRIGRTVSRLRFDGVWAYEQIVVRDDNLGCPNGQRNAPGQTRAWVVRVTVNGFGSYEYRVSNDSTLVFFCAGVGVGADVPPTAAAPPPAAGASLPIPPPIGVVSSPVTFSSPILAFVGRDGNVYVTSLGSAQGYVPLTGDAQGFVGEGGYTGAQKYYMHLRWSPDGSRLAFVEESTRTLFVVANGGQPVPIASGLSTEFPPAWSVDGSQIAYVTQGVPSADPGEFIYTVMAVAATGGVSSPVGQFEFSVGCGGGGFSPSLVNYYREAGYNGSSLVFKWTATGFLHTTRCDGVGLALSAPSGARLWHLPNVSRVKISPGGTTAVALRQSLDFRRGSEVVVIDLINGLEQVVSGAPPADQVGWSGDGFTIFLATRQLIQQVTVSGAAPLAPNFFLLNGESYRLGLVAVPAAGGVPQQVYESEGYAIAAITPAVTTSLIAFSIVESEVAIIGRINGNDSYQNVLSAAPRVKIGVAALPIGTPGYPYVIGADGGLPAFSPAAAFTAVPARLISAPAVPPGAPPVVVPTARPLGPTAVPALRSTEGDNPLGLVLGGRGIVPAGDPVILRSTPQYLRDRSNAIGTLRPNEVVRILVGPVFADNLRWWQIQRERDNVVGWIVDQYIDANGKVETNIQPLR